MGLTRSSLRAAFLAAGAGIFLVCPPAGGDVPKPCVRVIAPADGAALPPGDVLVIGAAAGEGATRVEIDVNGKGSTEVPVARGAFSAKVPVPEGGSTIRVRAGKTSFAIAVTGSAAGAYRYHAGIETCAGCHDGADYSVLGADAALCYRCHDRRDGGRNLHGPLGSGECTVCHDPHGSMHAALTVARGETLCVSCHDQDRSAEHVTRSRGKACTSCHDPHSSDKPYLRR